MPCRTLTGSPEAEAYRHGAPASAGVPGWGPQASSGREAGAVGAEGAGLVSIETSPHEATTSPRVQSWRLVDEAVIPFDARSKASRRIRGLRRTVWLASRLHELPRPGFRPDVPWFVTLTYRGVDDWRPDHIARCMDRYRRWCHRKGIQARYVTVAELQQRGAIHYHLVVWLPRGVRMPKWDTPTVTPSGREAAPFWPHGMTNRQRVRASATAYLMKYLGKLTPYHVYPKGCRTYSVGGLDQQARAIRSWSRLPYWVQCLYGVGQVVRRSGRLVLTDTGEILEPLYSARLIFGPSGGGCLGLHIRATRPPPQPYHSGPWSAYNPVWDMPWMQ